MSDLNLQISDAYKPTERQTSDLAFAAQALQVGANEMKSITGGQKNAVEAAGFAPAEDLLAGWQESDPKQAADTHSAPATKSELIAQFKKDYAEDTGPQGVYKLTHDGSGLHNAAEVKQLIDKRTFGQEELINDLNPQQLQMVGDLADAIKSNDSARLADILKSVKPAETDLIAFAVQYELQAKGVDSIQVQSFHVANQYLLRLVNKDTKTMSIFDERSGALVGTKAVSEAPKFSAADN